MGKHVLLVRTMYAPPGCDARAIHALQPSGSGPIWVVDRWLDWDVPEPRGMCRYRLKLAPWTALDPVLVH
jgi:hypothetical protein